MSVIYVVEVVVRIEWSHLLDVASFNRRKVLFPTWGCDHHVLEQFSPCVCHLGLLYKWIFCDPNPASFLKSLRLALDCYMADYNLVREDKTKNCRPLAHEINRGSESFYIGISTYLNANMCQPLHSDHSAWCILHDYFHYHPYKLAILQELSKHYFIYQRNACEALHSLWGRNCFLQLWFPFSFKWNCSYTEDAIHCWHQSLRIKSLCGMQFPQVQLLVPSCS